MRSPRPRLPTAGKRLARPRRLFGRWWKRQSAARQDRYATLGPLVSVLLFLAAIISAFWYLRNEEIERESESVKRDTEITQQQLGTRLLESQEALVRLGRDLTLREGHEAYFIELASAFTHNRPEVTHISWVDLRPPPRTPAVRTWSPIEAGIPLLLPSLQPGADPSSPTEMALRTAREGRVPVYSTAFRDAAEVPVFQLHVPVFERSQFVGAVIAEFSVDALLRYYVPSEVAQRHRISVIDSTEQVLSSTVTALPGREAGRAQIVNDAPLTPALNGLLLRGQGYRTSIGLIGNTLFWMVLALSALTVWMLLGTWRHMRRRSQIQDALVLETNFRRAMENSMPTGMRAMDLEGRITYVNAAFCQMTGFSEDDLIGRLPPFPYWPLDRLEENARLLQQELMGRGPAAGIEVKVMRKDGTLFDARMYVSPLVDPKGQQTGWMTSMTNITEAKRIRDQLTAAHERFTTVLEGLDAAVSVLSVQQGELLFVNRSYRLWFGADAKGHLALSDGVLPATSLPEPDEDIDHLSGLPTQSLTESPSSPREVYVSSLGKWFDVRARYLQWTDGRLAQMVIATDITARRRIEEQAAAQAEKAQVTSRLVTMGEMASSVAHELNQPLTAINNYCRGMISRVRADAIAKDDLIAALDKTSRQAERAAEIIRRIRAFVKRSEPQRQPSQALQIVEDAVELAGIELRRRNVAIHTYVAQRLPTLMVDPILIEQVLLNLLKNAAEAIDAARLPAARRHIELRVVPRHTPDEGGVIEFSVTDMGPGLAEEVVSRLYEAFFSTKVEGLGIGLSLCRSIIESHRGRMRGQNLYNGAVVMGCRFTFTLPVETHGRLEAPGSAAEPSPHASAEASTNPSVTSA